MLHRKYLADDVHIIMYINAINTAPKRQPTCPARLSTSFWQDSLIKASRSAKSDDSEGISFVDKKKDPNTAFSFQLIFLVLFVATPHLFRHPPPPTFWVIFSGVLWHCSRPRNMRGSWPGEAGVGVLVLLDNYVCGVKLFYLRYPCVFSVYSVSNKYYTIL